MDSRHYPAHRFSLVILALIGAVQAMPAAAQSAELQACRAAAQQPAAAEACWRVQTRLEQTFRQLWNGPKPGRPPYRGETQTLPSYPILELEDRDRDGKPDFFAYYQSGGSRRTQEFGSFFDLNGDGRADWIVYYGGTLTTKAFDFFFWYHHAVDTDGDGRFDPRIYEAIDLDGDSMPEREASAWLFDSDYDGLADKAQHVVKGRADTINPGVDGQLSMGYILETDPSRLPRIGAAMPTALFDWIAADIAQLSKAGGK